MNARGIGAWGIGLAAVGSSGAILDTAFRWLGLGAEDDALGPRLAERLHHADGSRSYGLAPDLIAQEPALAELAPSRNGAEPLVRREPVATFIGDLADKPVDAHDVYLRLHLLSHRLVRPNSLSLEGIFGLLANVAWTSLGPIELGEVDRVRWQLRARGAELLVHSVDKFPRMVDYVIPSGVRIADANRVRLGAHLAEGTTIMHEGFCNYNAGTLGASMVEGRISQGVIVGDHSDVGGGASIMGTLSGGGKEVIRVGEGCLLGANSGIGISLGNGCTVEAGLYVTAGSRVSLPDGRVVKAVELSGADDLLFRRNSQSGAIEVVAKKNQVVLNEALHANR